MSWIHDTKIDFVGKRRPFGAISLFLVTISWVLFVVIGPNWGIDFTGGTEIHLSFEDEISIDEVRSALRAIDLDDDSVQQVGSLSDSEFKVRIQDASFGAAAIQDDVYEKLIGEFGEEWLDRDKSNFDAEVGARISVRYNGDTVPVTQIRSLFENERGAVVQVGHEENEFVVQLPGLSQQIGRSISEAMGDNGLEILATDSVGPKVGGELRRQGFISIFATLGLVLIYIAFRFDLAFAPGAILALIHDVSITVGIFVVMGLIIPGRFEFNLPIIGALLTIVGYSLNDTIVIYDRIRENRDRYRRQDTGSLINTSINETLARTLATSVTTMFAMAAFLFFGGPVIKDFAFAMMCGIVFGTYSTMYVASPMILVMEDIKPFLIKLVALPREEDEVEAEAKRIAGMSQAEKRRFERQALTERSEGDA